MAQQNVSSIDTSKHVLYYIPGHIGSRLRVEYISLITDSPTVAACQRHCTEETKFECQSINYSPIYMRANCEMSPYNLTNVRIDNIYFFEMHTDWDFYVRR